MIDQRDIQYHLHYRGAELRRQRDQEALRQQARQSRERTSNIVIRMAKVLNRWRGMQQRPHPEPECRPLPAAKPATQTPAAP